MSVIEPPEPATELEPPPALLEPPPPPLVEPPRRRLAWHAKWPVRAVGVLSYGLLVSIILTAVVAPALSRLRMPSVRLTANVATQQGPSRGFLAIVYDLESRWVGQPALWQPSGVPANTEVQYFAVSGTTQLQLIDSLDNSGLCSKYHCLVDPAQPPGSVAWALEDDGYALPSAPYCYSPRTISYHFEHTILLPGWSPRIATVGALLVQKWNALEGVLLTHEAGHVRIADDILAGLNAQSQRLSTCSAFDAFWSNPHLWDGLDAAQNAYHARLRADCRPEIGCIPAGWMGW